MATQQRLTIGLDLGDRHSRYCILDEAGVVASEGTLPTTKTGLGSLFEKMPSSRVALEVGTHSPWASRHLARLGYEVIVSNPHKVKLITQSLRKNDRIDARQLARLARVDPQLLSPIRHRGEQAQDDLAVIRARAELVEARTGLINSARGLVKPMGERLKKCDADQVGQELAAQLSEAAQRVVQPLLKSVEALTQQIGVYDQQIAQIAKRYPEVKLLTQVYGVGTLIGLTFMLTIEDAERFAHSRDVGPLVGLQPKQRDSGDSQPQLGIQQGGRSTAAESVGASGALPLTERGAGQRSAPVGDEPGGKGRQEGQAKSAGGNGPQAGGVAAPVVGDRRGLRSAVQPEARASRPGSGLRKVVRDCFCWSGRGAALG